MPKHSKLTGLSEADFSDVCRTSTSIAEIIRRIGLAAGSTNYKNVKLRATRDGVDLSHIALGPSNRRGKPGARAPFERVVLSNNRAWIKTAVLRDKLIENQCAICGMAPMWEGKPLVLRLDHVNGDSRDHRLVNMRLVCPNCDSQLPTFAGRNMRSRHRTTCLDCCAPITKNSMRCNKCRGIKRLGAAPTKIAWPPTEELAALVASTSFSAVGRKLGVSDNAVRKRLRKHSKITDT